MSTEEEKMISFLAEIQLDQFYYLLVKNLHLTRIAHFDHVEEIDLTGIGMSKPEQRRLFEHLKKHKKPSFKKFFKKSFRRDSEKKTTSPPPNDQQDGGQKEEPLNSTMTIARNNIRQGLKCLISEKDIVLGEFLGKGAFGYVRKGVWTTDKSCEVNVAIKSLKPSHDEASVMLQNEFINEANAMSKLDHPNLIRLYGIVLTTPMMLVTELAPLGSLLGRLRQEPEKFMISILCSFVVQIVSGMKYLESNRFIHRDLAARNILLVSYEKIKIGDFGLMRALPSDADYYVMQPTGLVPFAWCATECLKYRRFSHASDVWAFGVTVLEMFSYGREPWPGMNGAEILERIDAPNFQRPERPDHCPVAIYKIIRNCCWCDDAEERKSFETLEKLILEVLPKELTTPCSYTAAKQQEISFDIGDPLTIVEASNAENVKAQNRRTGKVGYLPLSVITKLSQSGRANDGRKLSPTIITSPKSLNLAGLKKEKLLENDCLSVASRGSASSSGSDSSSGSTKYLSSRNALHSNPRDIPQRRQSSLSSGYGSAGPSYSNSLKDDSFSKTGSEFDYFAEEQSRKLSNTVCGTINENDTGLTADDSTTTISISSYENVPRDFSLQQQQQPNQSCYENTQLLSSPPHEIDVRHSSPIAIRKPSIQRHFSTASSTILPQEEAGSPTSVSIVNVQYIVSLPTNSTEIESAIELNSSIESELETNLSNSAPTTRSEIKAIRKSNKKQQQRNSTEINAVSGHRSSFGSYKEKWLPQVHHIIDKSVYECMAISNEQLETYELMNDNFVKDHSGREDITTTTTKDSTDSTCYENTVLAAGMSPAKPPLPPKTHRNQPEPNSEVKRPMLHHTYEEVSDSFAGSPPSVSPLPIPMRTYRKKSQGSVAGAAAANDSVEVYENFQPRQSPIPPRTYKKTGEEDFQLAKSLGEESFGFGNGRNVAEPREEMFCLPPKTYKKTELSYENVEIDPPLCRSKYGDRRYENRDLRAMQDSPPPLPRKRSQKTPPNVATEKNNTATVQSNSSRQLVNQATEDQPLIDVASCYKDAENSEAERKDENRIVDLDISNSSQLCNLIDDSPILENLSLKYGTVWDGKELSVEEAFSKAPSEVEVEAEQKTDLAPDERISEKEVSKEEAKVKEPGSEITKKKVSKEEVKKEESPKKVAPLTQESELSKKEATNEEVEKEASPKKVASLTQVSDISKKEVTNKEVEKEESPKKIATLAQGSNISKKEATNEEVKKDEFAKSVSSATQESVEFKPVSLLRALLSPTGHLSRKLGRSNSEDSPIPPPRKHRHQRREPRRHTLAGSPLLTRHDVDFDQDEVCDCKLPYDRAITVTKDSSEAMVLDAPSESISDAPPLLPRDPLDASMESVQSNVAFVEAEPKKIRIKSLLSEKVADAEEKDVEIVKTPSVEKTEEKAPDGETDKENIKYVLHFVTPV